MESITRSAVIGAGLMGAEIALVQAQAGMSVTLIDMSDERLAVAMARLESLLGKAVRHGAIDAVSAKATLARIEPHIDWDAIATASFVTEAVFETLPVKREVFEALDRLCAPDCVMATNTSTIAISTIAAAMAPDRRPYVVGTHYFSPVSRMKLVELIPAFETSAATLERARQLCLATGKTPIKVKDVTGFAVNRMLHALIIEAVRLVEEEVATPEELDLACRLGLGHAMGPFELMDAVTSSLCVQAQEIMHEAYGERFRPRPLLKQRVDAGFGGGQGQKGWRQ